jgi:hypothetical protein
MVKKKTYNITTSEKKDVLEIVVTGDNAQPLTHETMIKEIIEIDKLTNLKKQLVDIRKLKGRFTVSEIFNLVRNYPSTRPVITVALVDTPENAEIASFHEDTAFNAGIPLKWFTDIEEARKWLNADKIYTPKSLSHRKKAKLEDHCKELMNSFEGALLWKWDSRFNTVLAEFDVVRQDNVREILERHLDFVWDRSNISNAHRSVKKVNSHLGSLRKGQMLFTSDPSRMAYIYCAWWPWGNGSTISIRMAPCFKKMPDHEKDKNMQQFKGWFGI